MEAALKYRVFGVIICGVVVWLMTEGSHAAIRMPLRSLAISLVFAPTVVVAGWIGFPAPASLVLLGHFFAHEPKPYARGYTDNLALAGFCFVVFWVVTAIVYSNREAKK